MNTSSLSDQKDNHILLKILATKEEFKEKKEFFSILAMFSLRYSEGYTGDEETWLWRSREESESLKRKFGNPLFKYDFDVK